MSWLTEQEYRQAGAEATGVTLNVAFLMEIKTDYDFRGLLNETYRQLQPDRKQDPVSPRQAETLLCDLRDELETYFALEEFYGYFAEAPTSNPKVATEAVTLRGEHETLYLELSRLVDLAQQIVYAECGPEMNVYQLALQFEDFCRHLADHEQAEMNLMMQLCNQDIGVGD